jgi:hypothetical protein
LTNLFGSILCLIELALFFPKHKLEIIGSLLVFLFAAIFILDPHSTRIGEQEPNIRASLLTLLVNIPYIFFFMGIRQIGLMVDSVFEAVTY